MIQVKITVNINMRISKYLIGVWTAVAVYTLFSFFSGPKGISAYNQLLFEREQQWANIKKLGIINEELEKERNNLLYDQDTLLVRARQLGYGYEDERYIRIVGLGAAKSSPAVTGNVYIVKEPDFLSDKTIKIIAICVSLLIFAFLFMLEVIDSKVN
ncbi:MAG: septum formation initiator family protein [Treponema sp.]|jgi:cell division protein FtsB|nr:septum formation initiator family protein [Treponema sp.]